MKRTLQHLCLGLSLAAIANVFGCASEPLDSTTLVCTPGERKCDATSTKILECHPNGAAWALVSYCSVDAFCVNALCTGDGSTGFEGQGNPETNNNTTTEFQGYEDAGNTGELDATDTSEEADAGEEDGGNPEDNDASNAALTEGGEEGGPVEEGGGEETPGDGEEVILYEEAFTSSSAVPVSEVDAWTHHYCEGEWLMGAGLMSPQSNDVCPGDSCPLGFTSQQIQRRTGVCSYSPLNNFVTLSGAGPWLEYSYEVDFITWDNDAIGLILGYQDPSNFYVLSVTLDRNPASDAADVEYGTVDEQDIEEILNEDSGEKGFITLIRVSGSFLEEEETNTELLAIEELDSEVYSLGNTCKLIVDTFSGAIQSWLQCGNSPFDPVLEYTFSNPVVWEESLTGAVGLYSYGIGLDDLSCVGNGNCGYEGVRLKASPFSP